MVQSEASVKEDVGWLNCIVRFLAKRDLAELTAEELLARRGVRQVDRLILMGGITTPDFSEIVAEAYHRGLARGLMVVGGSGHSTDNLRNSVSAHPRYGAVSTSGRAEADILCDILVGFLGIERDRILVENGSTNCANNATFALEAARRSEAMPGSAIIVQDPMMQRRTHECFLRAWRMEGTVFDCFAPAIPLLGVRDGLLAFADPCHDRYYRMSSFLDLLMGEIPRLRDDERGYGYGPSGQGFIGHVEIPEAVLGAFDCLMPRYGQHVRPRYAAG
jgi:hypothetical protein